MDRRHQRDQQLESMAKPTGNARKAGPRPWELEKYIYQESSTDDGRSSHSDPRLELAQQSHALYQESDFIPHDGDPEQIHPTFGLGTTSDLHASDPSASDLGTLAGRDRGWQPRKPKRQPQINWNGPGLLFAGRNRTRNPNLANRDRSLGPAGLAALRRFTGGR
jgi:hypothetical protein